jgi:simple sugar transport system permease protein
MKALRKIPPWVNPVPPIFLLMGIVGICLSGMSVRFVLNELITRFIRDGVLVLSLVIPVVAGMGLNFAMVVGAICAQVGIIVAVDYQWQGMAGLLLATSIGSGMSILSGYLIGLCLNRVKGKEMITTIIIGFLATSLYQLVFMVGYGTVIQPHNEAMILSRGIGVRNMIDLDNFRNAMDSIWLLKVGAIEIPFFMILLVLTFALLTQYLLHTRLGRLFRAVGQSPASSILLGIDVDHVRIHAIVVSTLLACFGQILYCQNIGMLNVYTAHLNSDIFSCAALLAGGATIFRATVPNALVGLLLFHTLFIVSPQAGQNALGNAALGEYLRSFVAYGTIAVALIANVGREHLKRS